MKILITGGAGFIGSYLLKRLVDEGHQLNVLEKYSLEKKDRLKKIVGNRKIKIIWTDATKNLELATFSSSGYDWVFHLVGKRNTPDIIEEPRKLHQAHVSATVNLLEIVRKIGAKKFIYTTSAACYGKPDIIPTPETGRIQLDSPYALTKYIGEQYTLHYGKVYKLGVIVLRPFNVYGTGNLGSGYGAILDNFIAQKEKGEPFTVYGDGFQKRDFLYIDDLIEAYILAAKSPISGEVFNVGSGRKRSINELLSLLGGKIIYKKKRKNDIECMFADITKIQKMLLWKPKVTLEKGINKVLKNIAK